MNFLILVLVLAGLAATMYPDDLSITSDCVKDMVFEQQINNNKCALVFRVSIHGCPYILKVYHRRRKQYYDAKGFEVDYFSCESTAYCKLAAAGICERGLVPQFYGATTDARGTLPPTAALHLRPFESDVDPPAAILLEYVADAQMIDLDNFSLDRKRRFIELMREVHAQPILHCDIEPRHMLVQSSSDRLVLIDFDRAQTFSSAIMSQRFKEAFAGEKSLVKGFLDALESDVAEGRINKTSINYYGWTMADPSPEVFTEETYMARLRQIWGVSEPEDSTSGMGIETKQTDMSIEG